MDSDHRFDRAARVAQLSEAVAGLRFEAPDGLPRAGSLAVAGTGDAHAAAATFANSGQAVCALGDIAWSGQVPAGVDTVVVLSWSGETRAAIEAAQVCRRRGVRTVGVTGAAGSALAGVVDDVVQVRAQAAEIPLPTMSFVGLALGASRVVGGDAADHATPAQIADDIVALAGTMSPSLPAACPASISLVSTFEWRAAAEFWSLKLMEGTGLAVRTVGLEDSAHADYFIGPQGHLDVLMLDPGTAGVADRVGAALRSAGHHLDRPLSVAPGGLGRLLAVAAVGAIYAEEAAATWGRAIFRGGDVPMDSRYIA